jgi:hypothetical protein
MTRNMAIITGTHGSYLGEAMSSGSNSKIQELFVSMVNEFLATKEAGK